MVCFSTWYLFWSDVWDRSVRLKSVLFQTCRTSTARCQRQPLKRPRTGVPCCLFSKFLHLLYWNIFERRSALVLVTPQKFAMLDIDGLVNLHDIVCLWIWLRERLQRTFPMETVAKYENLFQKGLLSCISCTPAENSRKFGWGVIGFPENPSSTCGRLPKTLTKLAGVWLVFQKTRRHLAEELHVFGRENQSLFAIETSIEIVIGFLETPSQILEHWSRQSQLRCNFARFTFDA